MAHNQLRLRTDTVRLTGNSEAINGHNQGNGHYESNGHHTPSLFANGSHNDLHRGNGKHTVGGADSSAKVAPKASGNNMLENVHAATIE